jgi:ribosomal protein L37AE/L43A
MNQEPEQTESAAPQGGSSGVRQNVAMRAKTERIIREGRHRAACDLCDNSEIPHIS